MNIIKQFSGVDGGRLATYSSAVIINKIRDISKRGVGPYPTWCLATLKFFDLLNKERYSSIADKSDITTTEIGRMKQFS